MVDSYSFVVSDCAADIDISQLQLLFQLAAHWAKDRQYHDLEVAIANSHPVVTVWENERLIGFGRATSDGVYRAALWDIVIHPEYQGVGLGRQLMKTLLQHPHLSTVEQVYIMTSQQQGFYEHLGFSYNASTTMLLDQQLIPSGLPASP